MHIKRWTYFFVAVLSFEYASATFPSILFGGGYGGVHRSYLNDDNEGYYGWSTGCHCSDDLTTLLDISIGKIRSRIDGELNVQDYPLEEFEFNGGKLKGINKFQRYGPYRCALSDNYVRIFFRISFPRLLVSYAVHQIKSILSFLGGSFASLIAHFIGDVVDLVLRVAIPNVYLNVVLRHVFDSDDGCTLDDFYLPQIENIYILDKHFSQHQAKFSPYVQPMMYHVLRNVCQNELQPLFRSHFKKVRVERRYFSYSYSYKQEGSSDSDSDDSDRNAGGGNRRGIDSRNNGGSERSDYRSGSDYTDERNRGSGGSKGSDFGLDKDRRRGGSGLSDYEGNRGSRGSQDDDSGSGKKSHRSGSGLSGYGNEGNSGPRRYEGFSSDSGKNGGYQSSVPSNENGGSGSGYYETYSEESYSTDNDDGDEDDDDDDDDE